MRSAEDGRAGCCQGAVFADHLSRRVRGPLIPSQGTVRQAIHSVLAWSRQVNHTLAIQAKMGRRGPRFPDVSQLRHGS